MSATMSFHDWLLNHYKRDGEPISRAMARLQAETALGSSTIYYAYRGARVQPDVARRIEDLTGGTVHASELVMAPSRKDVKQRAAVG